MGGSGASEHCLVRLVVDLLGAATFIPGGDGRVELTNRLARDLVDARRGLTLARQACRQPLNLRLVRLGKALGITRGTATTHQKHIYSKLGINS